MGFPFSLSPCCTSILSTAAPRVKPQRCVLRHISRRHTAPVTYPPVPYGAVAVTYTYASVAYPAVTSVSVTYTTVTYTTVTYTYVAVTYGYVGESSPFFITKKPLFTFRGQVSATKRTIFEFRGSMRRVFRTTVERNPRRPRRTPHSAPGEAPPLRRTRIDSEAISAPDPNDHTGAALKGPQRATS